MARTLEEWHALVADLVPRDEFDRRLVILAQEFGGLLDAEAAAHFLVDELGRNPVPSIALGDLVPGLEGIVAGTVSAPPVTRTFTRRDGGSGLLAKLRLRDASGECDLLLWGPQAERYAPLLGEGKRVRLVNAYVKRNAEGRSEVHLGRWGTLDLPDESPGEEARRKLEEDTRDEPAARAAVSAAGLSAKPRWATLADALREAPGGQVSVRGRLLAREPTRTFFRDGQVRFVAEIVLQDASGMARVTVWGDRARDVQPFPLGSEIFLEGLAVRPPRAGSGSAELHANEGSRVRGP